MFYIKPLQSGEHILQLKVVVMAKIDNEYYKREKVLEESVVIIADAVQEDPAAPLKTLETFDLEGSEGAPSPPRQVTPSPQVAPSPAPSPLIAPSPPPQVSPSNRRAGKALRPVAMALAALMAFTSVSWAIAPQEVEWIAATLVNTPRQYEKYIEKHPKSRHREKATWEIAELTRTPRAYVTYLDRYPDGTRALQAKTELQQLETSDWQRVDTTTNLRLIENYIETYPSGRFIDQAREKKAAIRERRDTRKDTVETENYPSIQNDTFQLNNQPSKDRKFTPIKNLKDKIEEKKSTTDKIPPADMVFVRSGTFNMGDLFGDGEPDEKPTRQVFLSGYLIGRFEVTFEEFDRYCADTGADRPDDKGWGRGKRPVMNVSWYDAVNYCNWLSRQHGYKPVYAINGDDVQADTRKNGYRLPTEAEWEYAARSRGKKEKWAGTSKEADLKNYSNYSTKQNENDRKTLTGGSMKANALGVYDMSGNVREWCWDWFEIYSSGAQKNPKGPNSGSDKVLRGGSCNDVAWYIRTADRVSYRPAGRGSGVGFRLARN
ncbi:MAG: SUMF1/EgtB/PvdO family nonheme iron enzyme [Saprospiraceae bacterium]|nr:SUMF1/EgtB/PvdO family nonheme iron enzyme [Saprospiraceae bacterium]